MLSASFAFALASVLASAPVDDAESSSSPDAQDPETEDPQTSSPSTPESGTSGEADSAQPNGDGSEGEDGGETSPWVSGTESAPLGETPPATEEGETVPPPKWEEIPPEEEPIDLAGPEDANPQAEPAPDAHLLEKQGAIKGHEASVALYGFVVANVVYNTGSYAPTGEAPVVAPRGSRQDDGLPTDGSLTFSARQTRFGVRSSIDITEKVSAGARVEGDFFGLHENSGPGTVVQSSARLRLAYLEIGSERLKLLAGQDFVVVARRAPTSIGHLAVALHSFGGNIWNRLPQVTGKFVQPIEAPKLGEAHFDLEVSAARPFDGAVVGDPTRFDQAGPGARSKIPYLQGRAAFESKKLTVGAFGHYGSERYDVVQLEADGDVALDDAGQPMATTDDVASWLAGGDLWVSTKWVWFGGSGWAGRNLDGLFGGQGVRMDTRDDPNEPGEVLDANAVSLFGYGGWAEIGARPGTDKVKLVASGGADVGDDDAVSVGARHTNIGAFGAIIYAPHPNFDTSVEYLHTLSLYRGATADAPDSATRGTNDSISLNLRLKF